MDQQSFVPAHVARIAALDGFLQGISYLNQDPRSDFAEAFVVDAPDDRQVPEFIQSQFSHRPGVTIRPDDRFHGGMGQLERDIGSLLLVNPFVDDEALAGDLRSYLSFKIMDRLDDIINDWGRMDDASDFVNYTEPKRFIGTYDGIRGEMIFYLLRSADVCFALYFFSSAESS